MTGDIDWAAGFTIAEGDRKPRFVKFEARDWDAYRKRERRKQTQYTAEDGE